MSSYQYDVFISHASEDKKEVVAPLVEELLSRDVKVWYDAHVLKLTDQLRASIDRGLAASQFGVVILSRSFFRKDWPARELEALFALERDGRKVILAVWHEVTSEEVLKYSPLLAGRVAANTKDGIEYVAGKIIEAIHPAHVELGWDRGGPVEFCPPRIPVVLAGCGWWARQRTVLPLIAQNPSLCEVKAICEIKEERYELEKDVVPEFERRKIPMPPYYRTLQQAIRGCRQASDSEAPLVVVINTPNQLHESLAHQAFAHNCHVYAERPINRRSDELQELLGVAEEKNLLLYNGVQRRLEPPFRYLFHVVETQRSFGQLESIRCVLASGRNVEGWRRDTHLSGGGIVIDEGYHLLDAAVWLLEAAHPGLTFSADEVEVFARFGYSGFDAKLNVETKAFGIATLPGNVSLHFDFSYDTPVNSVYEMIEVRDREGNRVRYVRDLVERKPTPGRVLHQLRDSTVIGDGYVHVDPDGGFAFMTEGPSSAANNIGPLRQFLRRVGEFSQRGAVGSLAKREFGKNECDARFVLNTQELVTAIYRHDTGRPA